MNEKELGKEILKYSLHATQYRVSFSNLLVYPITNNLTNRQKEYLASYGSKKTRQGFKVGYLIANEELFKNNKWRLCVAEDFFDSEIRNKYLKKVALLKDLYPHMFKLVEEYITQ